MRISEILSWNNTPTEGDHSDPQLDLPPGPFDKDLTNLARSAFTRNGLVKSFWNLNGSEGQPSGPAPPRAETELIPNAPTTASWRAEPVEAEPLVGPHRLVPFRQ
jgi:hypothetical protein